MSTPTILTPVDVYRHELETKGKVEYFGICLEQRPALHLRNRTHLILSRNGCQISVDLIEDLDNVLAEFARRVEVCRQNFAADTARMTRELKVNVPLPMLTEDERKDLGVLIKTHARNALTLQTANYWGTLGEKLGYDFGLFKTKYYH